MSKSYIPLSVPKNKYLKYLANLKLATADTGNLFLFAGDQKLEHLNDDFFGPKISPEDANPEHLFKIAEAAPGSVLATHMGLLSSYGRSYPKLPYILKLNGKSSLANNLKNLYNGLWYEKEEIINFIENSNLNILGFGYTLYLGSESEAKMLKEAASIVQLAHSLGLLAILWVYPRNDKIKDEQDVHLIAGAAGVAASLGADFVKLNYPHKTATSLAKAKAYDEVIQAAGRTKVICVGGPHAQANKFLTDLDRQLSVGTAGLAVGRNLHQRSLEDATKLAKAIAALIHKKTDLAGAKKLLLEKSTQAKKLKKAKVKISPNAKKINTRKKIVKKKSNKFLGLF